MPYEQLLNKIAEGWKSPTHYQAQEMANQLAIAKAQQGMEDIPVESEMKKELNKSLILERQARAYELEAQREERLRNAELHGIKTQKDLLQLSLDAMAHVNISNWDPSVDWFEKKAAGLVPPGSTPKMDYFIQSAIENGTTPEQELEKYKQTFKKAATHALSAAELKGGMGPPGSWQKALDYDIALKNAGPPKPINIGVLERTAILTQFKDPKYLTDPELIPIATAWLESKDGIKAVTDLSNRHTPLSITPVQNERGVSTIINKGEGAGKVHTTLEIGAKIPQGEQDALTFIKTIKDTYEELEKSINKEPWGGGIGVNTLWGETGGRVKSPGTEYEKRRAQLALLKDIVYPKTGKQLNETELRTLSKYVPSLWDNETTFRAKMEQFWKHLESIERNKRQMLKEAGYGDLTKEAVTYGKPQPSTPPRSAYKTGEVINGKEVWQDLKGRRYIKE